MITAYTAHCCMCCMCYMCYICHTCYISMPVTYMPAIYMTVISMPVIYMPVTLLYQTIILFAISLPIATLAPFTLTIILPAISEMTVTSVPTTKPSFSRKDLTSSFPPIFLIICASPAPLIDNGIIFTSFHVFSSRLFTSLMIKNIIRYLLRLLVYSNVT